MTPQPGPVRAGGARLIRRRAAGPLPWPAQAAAGMRIASISGMNRGESPCWPQLVSRAMGRQHRSAARWILVVRPPRDRPIASRPDFVSFVKPPRSHQPPGRFEARNYQDPRFDDQRRQLSLRADLRRTRSETAPTRKPRE